MPASSPHGQAPPAPRLGLGASSSKSKFASTGEALLQSRGPGLHAPGEECRSPARVVRRGAKNVKIMSRSNSIPGLELGAEESSAAFEVRVKNELFGGEKPGDAPGGSRALRHRHTIDAPGALPAGPGGRGAACVALAFAPDGGQLAGGFYDGGLKIYDAVHRLQLHAVSLTQDVGGADKMRFLADDAPAITGLQWHPRPCGEHIVATTDSGGSLCFWEVPRDGWSPTCLDRKVVGRSLDAVAFTSDGGQVLVGGAEHVIKVYDIGGGLFKCTPSYAKVLGSSPPSALTDRVMGHSLKIVSICTHPSKPQVSFSAGMDKRVCCWDMRSGTDPVGLIFGPELRGNAMGISADGHTLLTASHRKASALEMHDLRMVSCNRSPAQATSSYDWQGDDEPGPGGTSGAGSASSASGAGSSRASCLVLSAAWDGRSSIVAAGEHENLARTFQVPGDQQQTLRVLDTLPGRQHAYWSAAMARDGTVAAVGNSNGEVTLCHVKGKSR